MKKFSLSLALALLLLATAVQAQVKNPTTRAQAQHKYNTRFLEKHMKQTEESLVKAMNDTSVSMQLAAVQTIRELEQVFPDYPFSAFLHPLEQKLKDENTDPVERMLLALALEGLHSEAGDAVIRDVANSCEDKGLQTLCKALMLDVGMYK